MSQKIVSRLKGGLGNQLFCYAAARRLAISRGAELVLDDVSGFAYDHEYRRRSMLGGLCITARRATAAERLEPFARLRRALLRRRERLRPFISRRYIEQEGIAFDARLLDVAVDGTVYLDGLWQSEDYFGDVSETIRRDLRIAPPTDAVNLRLADAIRRAAAVAIHVRWFDAPGASTFHNVSSDYYHRAMQVVEERVPAAHYFLFSDDAPAAQLHLALPADRTTSVMHNQGESGAHADLWLMSQCRHFIIANSTFSWWAAWLGEREGTMVLCPEKAIEAGHKTAWNFPGQLPTRWTQL